MTVVLELLRGAVAQSLWGVSGNRNLAVIQALLDTGADLEARDEWFGWMPLHAAVDAASEAYNRQTRGSHYPAVIQMLLDAGADMEARSSFYGTAVEMATTIYRRSIPEAVLQILRQAAAKQNTTREERR